MEWEQLWGEHSQIIIDWATRIVGVLVALLWGVAVLSLVFAGALDRQGIPFELHVYPHGPHGLSLATAETASDGMGAYPYVATWMRLAVEWLGAVFGG